MIKMLLNLNDQMYKKKDEEDIVLTNLIENLQNIQMRNFFQKMVT